MKIIKGLHDVLIFVFYCKCGVEFSDFNWIFQPFEPLGGMAPLLPYYFRTCMPSPSLGIITNPLDSRYRSIDPLSYGHSKKIN